MHAQQQQPMQPQRHILDIVPVSIIEYIGVILPTLIVLLYLVYRHAQFPSIPCACAARDACLKALLSRLQLGLPAGLLLRGAKTV